VLVKNTVLASGLLHDTFTADNLAQTFDGALHERNAVLMQLMKDKNPDRGANHVVDY
jgi:manganese/iron transport system ATP-binding protein